VDVHVSRLRRKLGDNRARCGSAVQGAGYLIAAD
jgi:DNA-binding response OmpR family regulator